MKFRYLIFTAPILLITQESFDELREAIEEFIPALAENMELLVALFLWTLPAQYLVGLLPQEAPLLYVSQFFNPFTVTAVVLSALILSEIANYQTVRAIGGIPQVTALLKRPGVQKPIAWFHRAPFTAISVAALTPIPFFPLRVLAPLSGYPLPKYICAVAVGRAPRIFLLALAGLTFQFPVWLLILIAVVPIVAVAWRLYKKDENNPISSLQSHVFKNVTVLVNVPNTLTASQLLIFLPLFLYGVNTGDVMIAFGAMLCIGIVDLIDGVLARWLNQETEFGKYFDYATDILSWLIVGFALAMTTDLHIGFVYFILAREILHISFAAYLSGKGVTTRSSRVATISGALTVATYCMYLLMLPGREILLTVTIAAMLNGSVYYFWKYAGGFREAVKRRMSE
jgi:phosphatidylglycerophosphate synthase/membrane protein DedA with SNARE-associated domain